MNRKHTKPPMKVTFHGNGGYEGERDYARKALEVGKEYLVIGGTMGQSITYYQLEGIEGHFNSVLFTGNPHEAPVDCPYFLGGKL